MEDQWKILTQIKGYLMALKDTPWCGGELPTKCFLWVMFVVGNWKGEFPILRCYEIDFTPKELWENWRMITEYARDAGLFEKYEEEG